MRVHGPSMAPLLNVNSSPELPETPDLILVQKNILFTARKKPIPGIPTWELQRGQLIVFHAPHKPEQMAVKRVVGIPGDRVQPLPGYPGGDEPVVVPYNHIWVEGDANSRDKSVDSNWYGPISQNLVVGFVKMVFTPWHAPVAIDWQKHDYPAKNSGRIEKDVVHDAKLDPDKKSMSEAFSNGAAARELAAIRRNRDELLNIMRDRSKFVKLLRIYGQAKEELEQHDPASEEVAQGLIDELERAFERVGLSKDGNQLPPPVRSSDESASKGESEQEIKQRRLKEYLQRQSKKDSAEIKNDSVDPFTMVTTS
jgi:signal peptidase I